MDVGEWKRPWTVAEDGDMVVLLVDVVVEKDLL